MTDAYEAEQRVAIDAVRAAAVICCAVQRELAGAVLEKEDKSPVTVADFASQAMICRAVGEAFPNDPIVGEEDAAALRDGAHAGLRDQVVAQVAAFVPGARGEDVCAWIDRGGADARSERFWTLDPIDGTKGFLRHEQYAIALALLEHGEVVVAALGCPSLPLDPARPDGPRGAIFTAVRGHGTRMLPLEGGGNGAAHAVRVSSNRDPSQSRFCESVEKAHSAHDRAGKIAAICGITAPPVRLDSQAKYAVVARGEADVYLRLARGDYREKIWDHAAGLLVCAEAGGRTTDNDGKPLNFTRGPRLEGNRGVIATNGALHDRVLDAVRRTASTG